MIMLKVVDVPRCRGGAVVEVTTSRRPRNSWAVALATQLVESDRCSHELTAAIFYTLTTPPMLRAQDCTACTAIAYMTLIDHLRGNINNELRNM